MHAYMHECMYICMYMYVCMCMSTIVLAILGDRKAGPRCIAWSLRLGFDTLLGTLRLGL